MVDYIQSPILVYHAAKLFAANQEIAIEGTDIEELRDAMIADLLSGETLVKDGDLNLQVVMFEYARNVIGAWEVGL